LTNGSSRIHQKCQITVAITLVKRYERFFLDLRSSAYLQKYHEKLQVKTRAEVRCVAKYYSDYCRIFNLEKFFKNDTIVFKITQPKKNEKFNNSELENARWLVHSFDKISKKIFIIGCNRIILANGSSDVCNRLGVKGENNRFCLFDLPSLEFHIENIKPADKETKLPVMVVGAGLSAADAVLFLRNKKIKVIHIYRFVN
jgi:hypothetical protein